MGIGTGIQIGLRVIANYREIEAMLPRVVGLFSDIQKLVAQFQSQVGEGKQVIDDAYALLQKIAPELMQGRTATPATEATYDVRWLQQSLNTLLNARLAVDGDYGPLTKSAVASFQKLHGLEPDGWAGAETEAKLVQELYEWRLRPS